ncbi:hypothetical protein ACP275_11G119100 [Erythranthe tilingii]
MSRTDKTAYDHSAKCSSVTAKPVNKVKPSFVSDNTDRVHGNRRRFVSDNTDRVHGNRRRFVSDNTDRVHGNRRYSDVQTGKKMTSSSMSAKKALIPIIASSSPKFVRGKIVISSNTRKTGKSLKSTSPSKNGSGTHSVGVDCEKILHVVENNAVEESPSLPNYSSNPEFDSSLSREKEKDDEQIKYGGNEFEDVFVSDKNIVQPPTESHDYIGNEFAADEIDVSISSEEIREETLEMGTENNAVEFESSSSSDSSSLSSCEDEDEEEEEDDEEEEEDIKNSDEESKSETAKQNPNKTLRKSKLVLSEDKNRSPIKLKFRSGRTVDLQPEKNTPRRLKFRRAKVNTNNKPDEFVSDKNKSTGRNNNGTQDAKVNQNKTSIRKNKVVVVSEDKYRAPRSPVNLFKSQRKVDQPSDITNTPTRLKFSNARASQRVDESKPENSRRTHRKSGSRDDAGFSVISSRKLVLKHQDLEGKKDDQGLLNNVIEETASKLVETRKSKVKALVGAFETVISLQERKPSRRS